jgi:hypothetical protein
MSKLDDEVQREMVRYCAGIDRWDAMPVVVEGWLRAFEQLQAQRDEMLAALRYAADVLHSLGREEEWERVVAVIAKADSDA